ncbi:sugar ABC transporter ATP-binding protein [Streptomyces sp. NPDC002346]
MSDPIISARSIRKTYGGVTALADASIELHPGQVHALCGANGAGKSTLKNVIAGMVTPDSGELVVGGQILSGVTPRRAAHHGIYAVHQELGLTPWLSVADNIALGDFPTRLGVLSVREVRRRANAALEALGVEIDPRTRIGELSIAQQQLVEIARAVAREPRCLILDEPSAMLVGPEVELVFAAVRRLREQGAAIVYVSHRLAEVFALADQVTVMRNGRSVHSAPIADFDQDSLIRWMATDEIARERTDTPTRTATTGPVRLSITGFGEPLEVRGGEIIGVAGLMGSGRSHLLRTAFGVDRHPGVVVTVDGDTTNASIRGATAAGMALVPEDRKSEGLVLDMPIGANLTMSAMTTVSRRGFFVRSDERSLCLRLAEAVGVPAERIDLPVSTLSGGNQQKVAMGRALARDPAVLLIDEPTRGVDVAAKAEIHRLVRELTDGGVAVLVVSSDFEELLELSDRIRIIRSCAIGAEIDPSASDEEDLLTRCTFPTSEVVRV